jgi:hypothetical protein|tara:strand:- start:1306 stop:3855 length:2550 start_codon:yes stop_codon:yes gene_type:complete
VALDLNFSPAAQAYIPLAVKKTLHEVVILSIGRVANAAEMTALEGLSGVKGDWAPLYNLVNDFMVGVAARDGEGAALKMIASNGLGLSLTDGDVASLAASIKNGQMTWADIFSLVINATNSAGIVLDNRADASYGFLASLSTAGKSTFYSGQAVNLATTNLLQGITDLASTLATGKTAFDSLATNLQAGGIKGAVLDNGYISGATVFSDANNNGVMDFNEWRTTSDSSGNYFLPSDTAGSRIIASGGTSILSNQAYVGVLSSTVGSTVINPFTTILQGMLQTGQVSSISAGVSIIQAALGLPQSVNPLSYDPLSVIADAGASSQAKVTALAVQASALQIANLITQFGAAMNAANATTSMASATDAVTKSINASLATAAGSGETVDLSDAAALKIILQASHLTTGSSRSISTAMLSQLAEITAAGNALVASADSITKLSQAASVAQGGAVSAITNGVMVGTFADAVSGFTGAALTALAGAVSLGVIAPGVTALSAIEDTVTGITSKMTAQQIESALAAYQGTSATIVATGMGGDAINAIVAAATKIATGGISGAISLTDAQFNALVNALNSSSMITVADTTLPALSLTAMDVKSSTLNAAAILTLTGTAAEIAAVQASSGITMPKGFIAKPSAGMTAATDLAMIDFNNSTKVDASLVTAIYGSTAEVFALISSSGITKPTNWEAIITNATSITSTIFNAIDASNGTGDVVTSNPPGWTITALNGKTVEATGSIDKFVFLPSDTGVTVTSFKVNGADIAQLGGINTVVAVNGASTGAVGDVINRVAIDTATNLGFNGINIGNISADINDVHWAVASDTGAIYYDADGNWNNGVIVVGTLSGPVTASDLLVG